MPEGCGGTVDLSTWVRGGRGHGQEGAHLRPTWQAGVGELGQQFQEPAVWGNFGGWRWHTSRGAGSCSGVPALCLESFKVQFMSTSVQEEVIEPRCLFWFSSSQATSSAPIRAPKAVTVPSFEPFSLKPVSAGGLSIGAESLLTSFFLASQRRMEEAAQDKTTSKRGFGFNHLGIGRRTIKEVLQERDKIKGPPPMIQSRTDKSLRSKICDISCQSCSAAWPLHKDAAEARVRVKDFWSWKKEQVKPDMKMQYLQTWESLRSILAAAQQSKSCKTWELRGRSNVPRRSQTRCRRGTLSIAQFPISTLKFSFGLAP